MLRYLSKIHNREIIYRAQVTANSCLENALIRNFASSLHRANFMCFHCDHLPLPDKRTLCRLENLMPIALDGTKGTFTVTFHPRSIMSRFGVNGQSALLF